MKATVVKRTVIAVICVLVIMAAWFSTFGVNRTIDKSIPVNVYNNNDKSHYDISTIDISGNLSKRLSATDFVGTFAITAHEPTCRPDVQAKIKWYDEDSQHIQFYHAGKFTSLDVKMIAIDEKMEHIMIVLTDGTIITTFGYYIPNDIWKENKG